ncbi:diacylglycerol kinase family protein [Kaistella palustris]|uniref:diacylglycerol kinase family protein n=1 Tax=Kaistella palustris TaxID=493376 RepID=UPI00048454B4|nr:diacylglycerol kinase family protein [Kaistella palustris]
MRKPPFHKSLSNAVKGVLWMLRSERNFQLEVLAMLLNLFLIVFLSLTPTDAALILIVCFAVLSLEILNTCAEKLCDLVQPDFDERIKIIKDIAAGAVVLMATASVLVGVLVYTKYLF